MIGKKYGRLTVFKYAGKHPRHKYDQWLCECDCGNKTIVRRHYLLDGRTMSCGCLRAEKATKRTSVLMKKHGLSGTRIYRIWQNMRRNCEYTNNFNYKFYGARGIKVCDEWSTFENFYEWSNKNNYSDTKFLNRYDKRKNYTPENCYFSTEVHR